MDHAVIWLEPEEHEGDEGRMWCHDNVWGEPCEHCGALPTKYVRADIHETVVSALRSLAQNMRDLHHYHTHNSVTGVEVWNELECDAHLAAADAALQHMPELV